jgi:phage N-6-adenine-methyltransferase
VTLRDQSEGSEVVVYEQLSLDDLAAEIRREMAAAEESWGEAVAHAVRAGELLIEAKLRVRHGEWLPWLNANFPGSEDTAENCMKLARNSERVRNLPSVRKALALLNASTAHLSSEKDEWATPQELFEALNAEFGFTLDVCATAANAKCEQFFDVTDDALEQEWAGVCWMNPPYSEIDQWMRKAYESAQNGATVVCLVPSRTDVAWTWEYARHGEVRFLLGRLHFIDDQGNTGPAPFPSAVVVFPREPTVVWWEP